MSRFDRPTVKVTFPDGIRDYPAEYEDENRFRPLDYRPAPMWKLVPVYNNSYDFIELFGGGFVAIPKQRVVT